MRFITCDRCRCTTGGEIHEHATIHVIGGGCTLPVIHLCRDCGEQVAEILDGFFDREHVESREQKRRREDEEMRARHDAWRATAGEQRQLLVLETLGPERLTVGQIAEQLTNRYREKYGKIFDTTLRNEVRRMFDRGELDRERCDKGNKPRYVYFRKTGLSGTIADLQAQLDEERSAER